MEGLMNAKAASRSTKRRTPDHAPFQVFPCPEPHRCLRLAFKFIARARPDISKAHCRRRIEYLSSDQFALRNTIHRVGECSIVGTRERQSQCPNRCIVHTTVKKRHRVKCRTSAQQTPRKRTHAPENLDRERRSVKKGKRIMTLGLSRIQAFIVQL